jgi:hypothetical protein
MSRNGEDVLKLESCQLAIDLPRMPLQLTGLVLGDEP